MLIKFAAVALLLGFPIVSAAAATDAVASTPEGRTGLRRVRRDRKLSSQEDIYMVVDLDNLKDYDYDYDGDDRYHGKDFDDSTRDDKYDKDCDYCPRDEYFDDSMHDKDRDDDDKYDKDFDDSTHDDKYDKDFDDSTHDEYFDDSMHDKDFDDSTHDDKYNDKDCDNCPCKNCPRDEYYDDSMNDHYEPIMPPIYIEWCWEEHDGYIVTHYEGYYPSHDESKAKGHEGADYHLYYDNSNRGDWCRDACEKEDKCKAYEYFPHQQRCELWTHWTGVTCPYDGFKSYVKVKCDDAQMYDDHYKKPSYDGH